NNNVNLCWYEAAGANPFQSIKNLRRYWQEPENLKMAWKAPNGIYWICGKKAYSELPHRWKGSCTLGMIRPSFFTLPKSGSDLLGAPL
ncbi:ENR1 protein, partial [Ptilonorhynchus violaceus]|nr:ENR1 protein [Ptilonorhynchus violaceus]